MGQSVSPGVSWSSQPCCVPAVVALVVCEQEQPCPRTPSGITLLHQNSKNIFPSPKIPSTDGLWEG